MGEVAEKTFLDICTIAITLLPSAQMHISCLSNWAKNISSEHFYFDANQVYSNYCWFHKLFKANFHNTNQKRLWKHPYRYMWLFFSPRNYVQVLFSSINKVNAASPQHAKLFQCQCPNCFDPVQVTNQNKSKNCTTVYCTCALKLSMSDSIRRRSLF